LDSTNDDGLRTALADLPLPVLLLDGAVIAWLNGAAAVRLDAADPQAPLGRRLVDLVEPPDRTRVEAALARAGSGRCAARIAGRSRRLTLLLGPARSGPRLAVLGADGDGQDDPAAAAEALLGDPLPGLAGVDYLERVLIKLVAASGAQIGFVGELVPDDPEPTVRTLRVVRDGAVAANFEYTLAGTPCARVFDDALCLHGHGAAAAYPDDAMLRELGVEGYAGAPLTSRSGDVLGLLVLLFTSPVTEGDALRQLLSPAVLRAGVELERIGTEARLARSEARYRQLVENAEYGLLVQADSTLLYANPASARILGHPDTRVLFEAGDITRFVAPEDRARVRERAAARLRGARPENHYEVEALHASGRRLRVEVNASEIEWEGRAALQIQFQDVTERALRSERQRQGQRMESLGKLTGGIAHDFNNLLAVILGNLELVEDSLSEDDAAVVHQARLAAERGADLTARLLAFARRQDLSPQRVELGDLLTETRALLKRVIGEAVEVRIELGTDRPVHVDPGQLQTTVINLAVNARDAMPEGGTLTLSTALVPAAEMVDRFTDLDEPVADFVCLQVEDSGQGMSDEVRERAFEPFFTTKGEARGTGLGLSMVHGFVRQSRGQIEIDSAPGAGTRIRLLLPVDAPGAEAPAGVVDGPAAPAADDVSDRTVLVVEDEASVREVAVAMLRGLGCRVLEAADGPSATAILEREEIDLLLSDVVLPGGQRGPEVAMEALERRPDLAVLFMSGYAESSEFQAFRASHRFSLIQKPFRLGELRARVQEALAGERAAGTE
jgi:PAS domain S-box-containing protein